MSSAFKVKVPVGNISRKMQRDHIDVLQNIEFVIVKAFKENPDVDDAAVREALVATLNFREPVGDAACQVRDSIRAAREMRATLAESIWLDGIRVVLDSVKNHSEFKPGETSYLRFVQPFVP